MRLNATEKPSNFRGNARENQQALSPFPLPLFYRFPTRFDPSSQSIHSQHATITI
jgi:hypothetical protein